MDLLQVAQVSVNCVSTSLRFLDKEMNYLVLGLMQKPFFSNCADKFSLRTDCLLVLFFVVCYFCPWLNGQVELFKSERRELEGSFSFPFFFTQSIMTWCFKAIST